MMKDATASLPSATQMFTATTTTAPGSTTATTNASAYHMQQQQQYTQQQQQQIPGQNLPQQEVKLVSTLHSRERLKIRNKLFH